MKKTLLTFEIATITYWSNAQTNTFPTTGNVGIGTTSPGKLFTIQGDSSILRLQSASSPTNYFTDIVNNYSAINPFYINIGAYGRFGVKKLGLITPGDAAVPFITGYYGIAFATRSNNPLSTDVKMSILQNGNVGIGTTLPTAPLDIFK